MPSIARAVPSLLLTIHLGQKWEVNAVEPTLGLMRNEFKKRELKIG
jgi:hypothetical protein